MNYKTAIYSGRYRPCRLGVVGTRVGTPRRCNIASCLAQTIAAKVDSKLLRHTRISFSHSNYCYKLREIMGVRLRAVRYDTLLRFAIVGRIGDTDHHFSAFIMSVRFKKKRNICANECIAFHPSDLWEYR